MGKGLISIVAKPTIGVISAVAKPIEGLSNSLSRRKDLERPKVRPPRFVADSKVLQPFDSWKAYGQSLLYSLKEEKFANQTYQFHFPKKRTDHRFYLIATEEILIYAVKTFGGYIRQKKNRRKQRKEHMKKLAEKAKFETKQSPAEKLQLENLKKEEEAVTSGLEEEKEIIDEKKEHDELDDEIEEISSSDDEESSDQFLEEEVILKETEDLKPTQGDLTKETGTVDKISYKVKWSIPFVDIFHIEVALGYLSVQRKPYTKHHRKKEKVYKVSQKIDEESLTFLEDHLRHLMAQSSWPTFVNRP